VTDAAKFLVFETGRSTVLKRDSTDF